jgi:hypothetical protein
LHATAREGISAAMDPSAPTPTPPIATPCIQVCIIDGESGLCLGCLRTLPEVASWSRYSGAERADIMAGLAARRGRIRPEKLAMLR